MTQARIAPVTGFPAGAQAPSTTGGAMTARNVSRRRFLQATGIAGGGLIIGFGLGGCGSARPPFEPAADSVAANAFLQITPDNVVRFYCPRDEMGQGVTTGLATLIGEELDVAPWRMDIVFPGPHRAYVNPEFGAQGTGGSTSIKAHYRQLREAGAQCRALLLKAAAKDLGMPAERLKTEDGQVIVNGESHPYGAFVATAGALEVPRDAPLKPDHAFKYIGKHFPRVDGMAKVTGTAVFGIDIDIPGMHHAVVRRSPVAGGTPRSVDKTAALAQPGVTDVVEIATGVVVVATQFWQAKKGADALRIEWNLPALAELNSARIQADYRAALAEDDGVDGEESGDVEAAFAGAETILEHDYWAPYLAHAPMEPMNAVVRIENGEADVWTGTQGIVGAQGLVARHAGLGREKVRAHNTWLGGGFGRRGTLTHVAEATQAAVVSGKPIHLMWTREDDIRNGFFRPASLMRIKAGLDAQGQMIAWQARRVGGNITPELLANVMPAILPSVGDGVIDWAVGLADGAFGGWMVDGTSVEGLFEDYEVANLQVRHITRDHGLPLAYWRSVGHSYTAFAKECMMDELAAAGGLHPVAFRLRHTRGKPRLNRVIRVAGEHMAKMRPPTGRHLGFAAHSSFGTDVAEVAEVSLQGGSVRVHRVLCVVDCGRAINPDIVRAQMEGAVMYGLTAALHGDLELVNGEIRQSNFHDYPILRMNEAPAVDVVIIDSDADPTGVGEPGLPPIAPAVANALYAATGQRLRSLPLRLS